MNFISPVISLISILLRQPFNPFPCSQTKFGGHFIAIDNKLPRNRNRWKFNYEHFINNTLSELIDSINSTSQINSNPMYNIWT